MKNWLKQWPSIGIFGGAVSWYFAHEVGIYFVDFDCRHGWILPTAHVIGFLGAIFSAGVAYLSVAQAPDHTSDKNFIARISLGAGAIFALVILYQGIALIIYRSCQR